MWKDGSFISSLSLCLTTILCVVRYSLPTVFYRQDFLCLFGPRARVECKDERELFGQLWLAETTVPPAFPFSSTQSHHSPRACFGAKVWRFVTGGNSVYLISHSKILTSVTPYKAVNE